MIKKYLSWTIYSILAFLLFGMGISLQIKAAIGQGMLNAFALTLARLSASEVGTVLNILNTTFFITYLIIRKTRFDCKDIVQITATIANGFIINLFVYVIFADLMISSYILKVSVFIFGLCLSSISLGAILAIGIIKFPLESLCIVLAQKFEKDLSIIRMRFDMFFLAGTLIITLISGNTLYIREGTIISFLLLSRFLGLSYHFFRKRLSPEHC